jgi:hypothetical protein
VDEVERAVLSLLLQGSDPVLIGLRAQWEAASVRQRELSGVGFFTHFDLPENVRKVTPADFELSDVYLELEGLEHGAGVVLFVRGGVLEMLEGLTFDEPWPNPPRIRSMGTWCVRPGNPNNSYPVRPGATCPGTGNRRPNKRMQLTALQFKGTLDSVQNGEVAAADARSVRPLYEDGV